MIDFLTKLQKLSDSVSTNFNKITKMVSRNMTIPKNAKFKCRENTV